jgi:hypothetical protein
LDAVAEEAHQAPVVHVGDDGDLSEEVVVLGMAGGCHPFDGDCRAVVEAAEDLREAALPHHGSEVSSSWSGSRHARIAVGVGSSYRG